MHNPGEAIGGADPVEATARRLVVALLVVLDRVLAGGAGYSAAMTQARADVGTIWRNAYGDAVAARTLEIIADVGPAEIMTRRGRAQFLERYPVEGMLAKPAPPPPREAIGGRLRQSWRSFWRSPTAFRP